MGNPLILFVAYHFPPESAIGGARPYRFYKYLHRLGCECRVLTAAVQPAGADPHIIHVPDPRRPDAAPNCRANALRLAERIGWKFFLRNDLALGWAANVFDAGRSIIDQAKDRDVVIISSAPPFGTHLAGLRLAAVSGLPWIADFRDPLHSPAAEQAGLQRAFGPAIERWILKRSTLVLANTDTMRQLWVDREPTLGDKIHVLWNGFDPEDGIAPRPLQQRTRKVVSHVGELYGGRTITPVLTAVASLIRTGRLDPGSILVRQVGPAQPCELPEPGFLADATSKGWLQLQGQVPSAEAREIALEADGLLLLQPHTALQVPGKLFEYLRMGRPIFAYVLRDSPVERILRLSGATCEFAWPEHSPQEIEERFLAFLARLDQPVAALSPWFTETFEASGQARTLRSLIDDAIAFG